MATYLLVALPVHFLFLGRPGLAPTEGIIALGGRNMLENGSWWITRLYGEPYAYKPPLAYWISAAGQWLGHGQSEWALRLPAAMAGLVLGCAIFFTLSRRISSRSALFAALSFSTSGLILEQSRLLSFDVLMALGFGIAFLAAYLNLSDSNPRASVWLVGYIGLLFGFLAKGVPAVAIFVPGLLAAALVAGKERRLLTPAHLVPAGLFVLGAITYIGLAWAMDGPQVWQHPLAEIRDVGVNWNAAKLLGTLAKPAVILFAFLPWTLSLVPPGPRLRALDASPAAQTLAKICAAFLIAGTLVFMAASVDRTRYYTLLAAPVAVLTGLVVEAWIRGAGNATRTPNRGRGFFLPTFLAILGLAVWLVHVAYFEPRRSQQRSLDGVAAAFALHIDGDDVLYVDTWDNHAALFFRLSRPVSIRRLSEPAPSKPLKVVVVDGQIEELEARTDLELIRLETAVSPQGFRYALVEVRSPASDP